MILAPLAMAAAVGLAPGCHHATMQAGSAARPFPVIECYVRHIPDHRLFITNDGADNDFDAGDVLIGGQVPV